jgi:two-component system, cell cycle sensor histidine kinase and response regulator CckA
MPARSITPPSNDVSDISFFADVFRESALPSVIVAPDSIVLFWNGAAERLFGWSSEEVLGRPLALVLVPPGRMDEHLQIRQRTLAGQGFSQHRITRLAKDGRLMEVSISTWPIRGADGNVIGIIGIYADVDAEELRFRQSLAEKQLEQVARLYATAPIGLGFLDTDLRFVRINERLAQIDGLAAEAHIGRRLAEVVPEVAAHMEGIYREVMATGVPVKERELRAATPALPGVPRVWQVSAYPLKDPDGTVLGVTVAVRDITEGKRWSEELERQEALLRLVIDGLPGMVFYVDRDRRYRFANRAVEEWFARPPRDFEGRKIDEALGETLGQATFESIRERVDRALAGEEVEADFHIRYPDRERDVHVHYVPDRAPDGEIRGMVSFVQDVTEQKQAERALRDSEERFRRMVEIAVEGIWILDATARTTFVNNRMADMLGYTREEMLSRKCFEFFDPEEREGARLEFEEQRAELQKITAEPHEHHFRHKDGSSVWLDITGTPMTNDSGTFTGVLKMCADVTERKKNEQRLRQAQKLESLGVLAGGVAHDFNNLLTAIIGNASLVLERIDPASSSRTMLQALITASERAAQLTRQLLTYAGKDQGKLQPLDLAAIVRELAPLLTAIIPKMVNLSLELEDGVHRVEADPAQLQHVMMNLVINAAESIPANTPGEVKVAVGRRTLQPEDYRDAVVPIETDGREYVSVRVTDNGSGMDAATQSRIFDPFFTTKFQGRGLGLAAVLGIVKGLGGTLTIQSAPGQGSVFTVLLPAIQAAAAAVKIPRRRSPGTAAAGIGTILFVDDDAALRAIAQQTLEEHGYRVLLAENGREAIAVASAHPEVRAVVLDLAMPVMGGDSAGPILRSLRPDVPLILSSGYPEWDASERVGPGVVAAFLEKPYQPGVLAAKVAEVLRIPPGNGAAKMA